MNATDLVLWLHLLCMVGVFGGLVVLQLGTPAPWRQDAEGVRPALKWLNLRLGVGLLAGLLLYGMTQGHHRGAHFNGVIGFKFVMLLGAGALLGMSRRSAKGDALRWIAAVLLAVAALAGISL